MTKDKTQGDSFQEDISMMSRHVFPHVWHIWACLSRHVFLSQTKTWHLKIIPTKTILVFLILAFLISLVIESLEDTSHHTGFLFLLADPPVKHWSPILSAGDHTHSSPQEKQTSNEKCISRHSKSVPRRSSHPERQYLVWMNNSLASCAKERIVH